MNIPVSTDLVLRDEYDDIWIYIFSNYISILDRVRVEKVCWKWRRLSKKAWCQVRSLGLQDLYGTDNDFVTIRDNIKALLFVLERSGWFLNRLDLSTTGGNGCDQMKFDLKTLRTVARLCPNLHNLNLSQLHLTNEHLTTLSEYLATNLNSLILIRCFDYEHKPDSVLSQLLKNLPHLRNLELSENDTLTGRCFFDLLDQRKRSTTNLCYNTLNNLALNKCQNLKTKYLNCLGICYPNLEQFQCSNQNKPLNECLMRLNKLIKLNLSFYKCDSSFLDDQCWKNVPNLKYLDMGHSSQINYQTLKSLFGNFCSKNLEYLNISGKNERLNVRILENLINCQNLMELDLSWSEIDDQLAIKSLSKMSKLEKLHLHACSFIGPDALLRVIRVNKRLKFLDVTFCQLINGAFLTCLSRYVKLKRRKIAICVDSNQLNGYRLCDLSCQYFKISIVR